MSNTKSDKVIGVLGGMGPEATIDFYAKLLHLTPAKRDQEHFRVIIDSNGKVPDRVQAILSDGPSPAPVLKEMAQGLEAAGADFLVIPCNTAHYFYDDVQSSVKIPVLHLQREVFVYLRDKYPSLRRIGLLATTATVRTGLYQIFAEKAGLVMITPNEDEQEALVTAAIKAVKSGEKERGRRLIRQAAEEVQLAGAEIVIAGCTEIPLILSDGDLSIPVLDSALVLAEATFATARA